MTADVRQANRKRLAKVLTQNYILPDKETLRYGEGELVLEFIPKLHKKTEDWKKAYERAWDDADKCRRILIQNEFAAFQPQFGKSGPFYVVVALDCVEEQQHCTAGKTSSRKEVA